MIFEKLVLSNCTAKKSLVHCRYCRSRGRFRARSRSRLFWSAMLFQLIGPGAMTDSWGISQRWCVQSIAIE